MSEIVSYEIYAWMSVYYRQVAGQEDFGSLSVEEQWYRLRDHILSNGPPSHTIRAEEIDSQERSKRPRILNWLKTRDQKITLVGNEKGNG